MEAIAIPLRKKSSHYERAGNNCQEKNRVYFQDCIGKMGEPETEVLTPNFPHACIKGG
jgi:hypothetical protein